MALGSTMLSMHEALNSVPSTAKKRKKKKKRNTKELYALYPVG
jgi:hypothetical protein